MIPGFLSIPEERLLKLLCKNKISMLENRKPKAPPPPLMDADGDGRMTAEDIVGAFKVPEHLIYEIDHNADGARVATIVEIAALEFLRKSAQRYLDEMAPGKFTIKVNLNKNTVAGSNPAGGD